MKKASNYTFLSMRNRADQKKEAEEGEGGLIGIQRCNKRPKVESDLNVFVLTFDGTKQAEKHLAGGDPYECKKCKAILNKYSTVLTRQKFSESPHKHKLQLKPNQSFWECEFCQYPNTLLIDPDELPTRDDVVYMLESHHQQLGSQNDSTMVFCIDTSGSMNTTSQIAGKVELKYGLSQEEIQMLKAFMEPGDQAQFNFLPGSHNKNKTFISRKQCILSAIQNQLNQIKKQDPNRRVGFILFNNQVTVLGDGKAATVNILGDKLNKQQQIKASLEEFKLSTPIAQSFDSLITNLNKTEAKGQTALGPALISAIEVASRGSPGSTVILCTDGLANIGVGSLDFIDEGKRKFYEELATVAKEKNITVNIMTIKGEGCKVEIIGKLAEYTNGNVKVVNPQKLADDFANVLRDQVVGLNVQTKIMLHKAMVFRNEDQALLKDSKTILVREFANATANTKISFQYQVRQEQDLKFMQIKLQDLKKVPFQAQIIYTSPKGGKYLRVISSESKTTTQKKEMQKQANLGVVHQRVTSLTAAMYSRGQAKQSQEYNNQWAEYLDKNFQAPQYKAQQEIFSTKNKRLNEAISHKIQKRQQQWMKSQPVSEPIKELPIISQDSQIKLEIKPIQKHMQKPMPKSMQSSIIPPAAKPQKIAIMSPKQVSSIKESKPIKKEQEIKPAPQMDSMMEDDADMQLMNNLMEKQGDYFFD